MLHFAFFSVVHVPELSMGQEYGVYCYNRSLYIIWDDAEPVSHCYELQPYYAQDYKHDKAQAMEVSVY